MIGFSIYLSNKKLLGNITFFLNYIKCNFNLGPIVDKKYSKYPILDRFEGFS